VFDPPAKPELLELNPRRLHPQVGMPRAAGTTRLSRGNCRIDDMQSRLAPYRAFQFKRPDALRVASEEHAAISDAVVSGNRDAAYRLLPHVSLDNELLSDLVAALSSGPG
jgi:DNA-binding GntR family transcriptional regulator